MRKKEVHGIVLELAILRFPWEMKKLVLAHRQGHPLGVIGADAAEAFVDLGIIETDRDSGQLKIGKEFSEAFRHLTVAGLVEKYPEKKKHDRLRDGGGSNNTATDANNNMTA